MRIFAVLLLFLCFSANAQVTLTGIVKSSENTTLPFATIITEDGQIVISDVDGKFIIEEKNLPKYFTVTYIGFKSKTVQTDIERKFYTVLLKEEPGLLHELVIEKSNAANRIIKEAIRRKPQNNPQHRLSSFRYKSYDKLIVTAHPDSISGKLDSIYLYEKAGRRFLKIDSSSFKFKKLINKQHLYQTEKISEFNYNSRQGLKENVLATRMAGFKQPLYELISLKLQSYSVYEDIDIVESRYAGPLTNGGLSEYNFTILDTVPIDSRQSYMVYFTPKRKKSKNKLEGILYIDFNNYGIAKAIFRVKNVIDVTANYYFKYEQAYDMWFPDRKTLKIIKGSNKQDINILGETIKFDAPGKKDDNREKEPSDYIYAFSESVNFEKEFNIPLEIKRASVAIEIKPEAINRPESYWEQFRTDTLDNRSMKTYMALDSLVAKDRWEERIKLGRRVINGYIPVGPFDIDLKQVIRYNNFEGFRLGLGGITNDKFSEIFRISTYGAYGTKDGRFKYSLGGAVRLGKFSNSWVGGAYTDDLQEIGSTSFAIDKRVFKLYDPRPINVNTFYHYETWQGYVETMVFPKSESRWTLATSRIEPLFDYIFTTNGQSYSKFHLTTASASIQWNPFSEFMQTPKGKIEIEKRFPKFTFQYTQAISGLMNSDFSFGKLDFRAEYEKKYLNRQKTSFLIQTGVAAGDVPLTHLYSTSPNNLDKDGVLARITFAGKNSFETMYFNEFFSSQYISFQAKHAFARYALFGKVKLSPVIVSRAVWGNMEHRERHEGIEYNTLEKGYYESGFELNEIFMGFGLSGFYRYGPYHLPEFDRNISIKLSFILNLGI